MKFRIILLSREKDPYTRNAIIDRHEADNAVTADNGLAEKKNQSNPVLTKSAFIWEGKKMDVQTDHRVIALVKVILPPPKLRVYFELYTYLQIHQFQHNQWLRTIYLVI